VWRAYFGKNDARKAGGTRNFNTSGPSATRKIEQTGIIYGYVVTGYYLL
jgi:hypothetical protein